MKSTAALLPGAVHLAGITARRQLDHLHNPHLVDAARIGRVIIGHQVDGARVEGGQLGGIGVDVVGAGRRAAVVVDAGAVQRVVQVDAADNDTFSDAYSATLKAVGREKSRSAGVSHLEVVVSVVYTGRVWRRAKGRPAVEMDIILTVIDIGVDGNAVGLGREDGTGGGAPGSPLEVAERQADGQGDDCGDQEGGKNQPRGPLEMRGPGFRGRDDLSPLPALFGNFSATDDA